MIEAIEQYTHLGIIMAPRGVTRKRKRRRHEKGQVNYICTLQPWYEHNEDESTHYVYNLASLCRTSADLQSHCNKILESRPKEFGSDFS